MDIIGIIETVGIPVAVAIGLGYALMYLIKFITKDVTTDIKNLYNIVVKLIDSNREAKDEVKKTMTGVNTIKDIIVKLFKNNEFDKCVIFYNKFKNVMTQIPQSQQLIPAKKEEDTKIEQESSYDFAVSYTHLTLPTKA